MPKAPPLGEALIQVKTETELSVDLGSSQSNRSCLTSSQVEGEVVSIALVHHFHTQVSPVEDVGPSADYTTLRVNDRLVEVETVEVERHGADAQCGEPDANYRPCS
jgi:hypothetical protein